MTEIAAAGSTFEFSPWFFVVFGLALVIASTLGPLSRLHERREAREEAATRAKREAAQNENVDGRRDEEGRSPA